jgi:aryl-alcohol dehydrogenase-like predicted oxidoreductase
MRYARLGDADIEVSVLGLGVNTFGMSIDRGQAAAVVDAALECGINFFDTAASYGDGASERMLGEAIRGRRDEVVIATKFGDTLRVTPEIPPGRPDQVVAAVDGSLDRLGVDHADLVYLHMPDPRTPLQETLGAMQQLVADGKARAIGCSNVTAAGLQDADELARDSGRAGFVAIQNQYGLLERDADVGLLPLARERGVAFIPYMPLANGLLTGKYRRGALPPEGSRLHHFRSLGVGQELLGDDRFGPVERLQAFAAAHGRTLHELAIAAPASTPGIASVLVGATSPEQVRSNARAAAWELDADTLQAIPRFQGLGMDLGFSRANPLPTASTNR